MNFILNLAPNVSIEHVLLKQIPTLSSLNY